MKRKWYFCDFYDEAMEAFYSHFWNYFIVVYVVMLIALFNLGILEVNKAVEMSLLGILECVGKWGLLIILGYFCTAVISLVIMVAAYLLAERSRKRKHASEAKEKV